MQYILMSALYLLGLKTLVIKHLSTPNPYFHNIAF